MSESPPSGCWNTEMRYASPGGVSRQSDGGHRTTQPFQELGWEPVGPTRDQGAATRSPHMTADPMWVPHGSRSTPSPGDATSHPDELTRLIAEQARDDTYRVWTFRSLDTLPSGADITNRPPDRLLAHDDRHGLLSTYTNLRCRCAKCRAASARYARDRRRRLKVAA